MGAAAAAVLLATLWASPAWARSFRVEDIPNGNKKSCLNCHGNLQGVNFTDFGSDSRSALINDGNIVQERHVDWSQLCNIDSDRDGWTNGQELNDPTCSWAIGKGDPGGTVYNPGDKNSHPPPVCNSGKLEAGEECDGSELSAMTCDEIGMGEGTLACNADCTFDTSGCSNPSTSSAGTGGGGSGDGDGESGGCSVGEGSDAASASALVCFALGLALMKQRRSARRAN
ncbi:MAG: hypothetical protein U0271_15620 [Polyangiaceae bacterium]